ncbi:unnamed protein product, partial [Musa acuminata var. zebrina]
MAATPRVLDRMLVRCSYVIASQQPSPARSKQAVDLHGLCLAAQRRSGYREVVVVLRANGLLLLTSGNNQGPPARNCPWRKDWLLMFC